jgi:hypothetical protein
LFYGEIRWTKLNKIVILPYFPCNPKTKVRLEVLLGFAIPALFFRTGITVLEDLRHEIPVPEPGFTVV